MSSSHRLLPPTGSSVVSPAPTPLLRYPLLLLPKQQQNKAIKRIELKNGKHGYFGDIEVTTRKHTEFRRRFRRTPRSSDISDGILTNFRPNPKKLSRRNSVGHFRRNSDEIWFVGIFRRLFDDIPIKNITVVVVGSSSVYSDEFPTTFD
ncbi:hypothetical protein Bca4012_050223 [Brassica carinata]